MGAAFLALSGALWWRDHAMAAAVSDVLAGMLLMAALLMPGRLGPVYHAWMGLAAVLSRITTPLFLALVYFGMVVPMGVVMRLAGRNALVRRRTGTGYWVTRSSTARRGDMERQF